VSQVVNLNRARKAKARQSAGETAAENRIRFGRTKAERGLGEALKAQVAMKLDQARRNEP
jgi:hypothetical protein